MDKVVDFDLIERQIEARYGVNRGLVLAVGTISVLLGVISAALPVRFFGSLLKLVACLLIVSGAIKAAQLLLGRRSSSGRRRGRPVILAHVALDLAMGLLLFNNWGNSARAAAALLGLLFVAEGSLLLIIAIRSPTVHSLAALSVCGLFTAGVGVILALGLVANPLWWAGALVAAKLISFGVTLIFIAVTSPRTDSSLIYGATTVVPEPGELYAVYFGTAFHLGVYIGDGMVVHYLNDNRVYKVTWEQFQDGRFPQHWTYPDIEPVPLELIKQTALAEVGKTYPYNLLTFNCENFAVYCKSAGKTRTSRYAQVAGGVSTVALHPLVGMVAEVNTRAVEWLAFQFGGRFGKRLSLEIRRVGAWVTTWLVTHGAARAAG